MLHAPQFRLAKCTKLLADTAEERGFAVQSFPGLSTTVAVLEKDGHREVISESATPKLSTVMYKVLCNKALTTNFLRDMGYLVPRELLTNQLEEAREFLREVGKVVMKPNNLTWGEGVFTGITDEAELEFAFERARSSRLQSRTAGSYVLCQEHLEGDEYRILVVDQQHVFGLRREPARLVGDGRLTVSELLEKRNREAPVTIKLDELVVRILKQQSVIPSVVLPPGQSVFIASVANAHAGGTTEDVTGRIGEAAQRQACDVSRALDLPLVGIDCFSQDLEQDIGYIIELNATPDIVLHHTPTFGEAQDVAGAVLDMLFPEATDR